MKSLPYTTMCIKEAMRLYPPVPFYFRDISEDINIHGHLIPKGTNSRSSINGTAVQFNQYYKVVIVV